MKNKWSSYTARIVVNSHIYLYNTYTDQLIETSSEIDSLITQHKEDVDKLNVIHPELHDALMNGGFIVEMSRTEWKEIVANWELEDKSLRKFTMTINPTLNCNMRCWYCYEKHDKTAYMTNETILSVKKLIHTKVTNSELRALNINFFGGEPLLHYEKCVHPILEFAYEECILNKKQLFVSFTTNAYLLSERIIENLKKYAKWGHIKLQITLDGNEKTHDSIRSLSGKYPTYRTILKNIIKCAENDFKVLVRFNYTNDNILSYYDVIEDFQGTKSKWRDNITFALHKVWQERESSDLQQNVEEVLNAFKQANLQVESLEPLKGGRCYGDRQNFIVINYNGDLYKCTAREFIPKLREGYLEKNGELVWNDIYKKRMLLKKCPSICHDCILFPLCHAGCTQNKLEFSGNLDECLRHYSETQKKRLLESKIQYQLKFNI